MGPDRGYRCFLPFLRPVHHPDTCRPAAEHALPLVYPTFAGHSLVSRVLTLELFETLRHMHCKSGVTLAHCIRASLLDKDSRRQSVAGLVRSGDIVWPPHTGILLAPWPPPPPPVSLPSLSRLSRCTRAGRGQGIALYAPSYDAFSTFAPLFAAAWTELLKLPQVAPHASTLAGACAVARIAWTLGGGIQQIHVEICSGLLAHRTFTLCHN